MPELPEVETIKNVLKELTLGKKIEGVDVLRAKTIDGDSSKFISTLKGLKITGFERVGKFIIFKLEKDVVLISHLRMEGKYFLKNEDEKTLKHDLVIFHFSDKTKLVYNDTRKFGRMKISTIQNYKNEAPLSNVGPDPFMIDNAEILIKNFKNKNTKIKTALLDQSIMSGLGNIYADEVLFATKIHPETPAKLLTEKELNNIVAESKKVLSKALEAGGTTIKSYHPKEGVSGNFQVELQVYGKKGKECPRCGTKLEKIVVNGRGTTFCPKCQKILTSKKVYGITGPIGSGKSTISLEIGKLGYTVINCDDIVHQLYKNFDVQKSIKNIIPTLKISNGEIDREYLKDFLINNKSVKEKLEKLIFKIVKEQVTKIINKSKNNVVLEAPLLFEAKLDSLCDEIVYIDVEQKQQIQNLEARNSDVKSSLKINESFDKEKAKKKATIIIKNNKDVAYLINEFKRYFL